MTVPGRGGGEVFAGDWLSSYQQLLLLCKAKVQNKDAKSIQDPESGARQGKLDVITRMAHTLSDAAPQPASECVEARRECGAKVGCRASKILQGKTKGSEA